MDIQNNNEFPLEIQDVEPKLAAELMKSFTGMLVNFFITVE